MHRHQPLDNDLSTFERQLSVGLWVAGSTVAPNGHPVTRVIIGEHLGYLINNFLTGLV
jgi:hypothetical protein